MGMLTITEVPEPFDSIFISPWKCRIRSRIPLIPTPEPWARISDKRSGDMPLSVILHLGSHALSFASYSDKSGLVAGVPVDIC